MSSVIGSNQADALLQSTAGIDGSGSFQMIGSQKLGDTTVLFRLMIHESFELALVSWTSSTVRFPKADVQLAPIDATSPPKLLIRGMECIPEECTISFCAYQGRISMNETIDGQVVVRSAQRAQRFHGRRFNRVREQFSNPELL